MIRGPDETRGRIERERVVRLATIGARGRAHVVPGVFAVVGDIFCSPTDAGQGRSWPRGLRNLDRDQRARSWPAYWPKVWRFLLRGTGRRESGAHAMVREVR
jgi:hypothetical protein